MVCSQSVVHARGTALKQISVAYRSISSLPSKKFQRYKRPCCMPLFEKPAGFHQGHDATADCVENGLGASLPFQRIVPLPRMPPFQMSGCFLSTSQGHHAGSKTQATLPYHPKLCRCVPANLPIGGLGSRHQRHSSTSFRRGHTRIFRYQASPCFPPRGFCYLIPLPTRGGLAIQAGSIASLRAHQNARPRGLCRPRAAAHQYVPTRASWVGSRRGGLTQLVHSCRVLRPRTTVVTTTHCRNHTHEVATCVQRRGVIFKSPMTIPRHIIGVLTSNIRDTRPVIGQPCCYFPSQYVGLSRGEKENLFFALSSLRLCGACRDFWS